MNVQLKPASDEDEKSARERMAAFADAQAEDYEAYSQAAITSRKRSFWLNRASEARARAAKLRQGTPS